MNDKNIELKKYESIISIWRRWDESYWTSFYVFVIVIGLLLAGYSQMIDKSILLSVVYSIAGILISTIWLCILNRKLAYIYIAQGVGREIEKKVYQDLKKGCFIAIEETKNNEAKLPNELNKWQRRFAKRSSGRFAAFYFPLIIIGIWILILIVTLIYELSDYFCMCVDALMPIGLLFNVVGVIILLIPQIFVKTEPLTPGESQVSRTRKKERPLTILGLVFILIGFILQFIAQFL